MTELIQSMDSPWQAAEFALFCAGWFALGAACAMHFDDKVYDIDRQHQEEDE